jgi:hypothetical protein
MVTAVEAQLAVVEEERVVVMVVVVAVVLEEEEGVAVVAEETVEAATMITPHTTTGAHVPPLGLAGMATPMAIGTVLLAAGALEAGSANTAMPPSVHPCLKSLHFLRAHVREVGQREREREHGRAA